MKKPPKKFTSTKSPKTVFQKPDNLQKSPNISRKIPEHVMRFSWKTLATIGTHWQVIFVSFISGVLLMAIMLKGVELRERLMELHRRDSLRASLEEKRVYWDTLIKKYPDYKDAYFQLAVVSYQLGEKQTAREAIKKVLELDPNDTTVRELERKADK